MSNHALTPDFATCMQGHGGPGTLPQLGAHVLQVRGRRQDGSALWQACVTRMIDPKP